MMSANEADAKMLDSPGAKWILFERDVFIIQYSSYRLQ